MTTEQWADRSTVETQYGTDANLSARQAIYAFQRPRVDLVEQVAALLGLRGDEAVADVGCGNGRYLTGLLHRHPAMRVVGLDLSPGMLCAARAHAPRAAAAVADAGMLPLADASCDVSLAMHMLYHLPSPAGGLRELRRVTRPGGRAVVMLNGADHLWELRDLVSAGLRELGHPSPAMSEPLALEEGEVMAAEVFGSVTRRDFMADLVLTEVRPVADYVGSMVTVQHLADPGQVAAEIAGRIQFGSDGVFRVRTHVGCLVCS